MTTVYFDFETAGVEPHFPDIQLAAVAVDAAWVELEAFQMKIQFDEAKADPEALKINHYDPEVWAKEAQPEALVVARFAQFLNRHKSIEMISKAGRPYSVARLAGHNAATFDGPRLKAMFQRHAQFLAAHPQVLDTLQNAMWYAYYTGTKFKSLKLSALCEHFGIPFPDAHDALADCRASMAVAKMLRPVHEIILKESAASSDTSS